jgi:hypothetical protein
MRIFFLLGLSFTATLSALPQKSPSVEIRRMDNGGMWMLPSYLALVKQDPARMIAMVEAEFRPEALRAAKSRPEMASAWQDRVAWVGALTEFFNPDYPAKANRPEYEKKAFELIRQALQEDASLLVRDGAVEAVRRIVRMRPAAARAWRPELEKAFMDRKNILDGEGLFIRETILTAMRDASLPLSRNMRRAAELDQNIKVRNLLRLWNTSAFDSL